MLFQMTVSSKQMDILSQALDLYYRLNCGQIQTIVNHAPNPKLKLPDKNEMVQYLNGIKNQFTGLSKQCDFGPMSSMASEVVRIAYDLMKVIDMKLLSEKADDLDEIEHLSDKSELAIINPVAK